MCEIILIGTKLQDCFLFVKKKFCEKAFEKSDTNELHSLVLKRKSVQKE
jgi:hypothetical protein